MGCSFPLSLALPPPHPHFPPARVHIFSRCKLRPFSVLSSCLVSRVPRSILSIFRSYSSTVPDHGLFFLFLFSFCFLLYLTCVSFGNIQTFFVFPPIFLLCYHSVLFHSVVSRISHAPSLMFNIPDVAFFFFGTFPFFPCLHIRCCRIFGTMVGWLLLLQFFHHEYNGLSDTKSGSATIVLPVELALRQYARRLTFFFFCLSRFFSMSSWLKFQK